MTRIYHLHLKLPFKHRQTTDYYFSSMAAIYERFTPDQLGIKYTSLRNCKAWVHKAYKFMKSKDQQIHDLKNATAGI